MGSKCAGHGVRDLFGGRGQCNSNWGVVQTQVKGLVQTRELNVGGNLKWNVFGDQAVGEIIASGAVAVVVTVCYDLPMDIRDGYSAQKHQDSTESMH